MAPSRFTLAVSAIAFIAVMMGSGLVHAQVSGGDEIPGQKNQASRDLDVKIRFCRQLMLDQNFAGAADMLELLYENYPGNPTVVGMLVQCYDKLQLYDKAEEIIRRHLTQYPDNFNFLLLYAEILARQGRVNQAATAYLRAAADIPLNNLARYQLIVQSMVTEGLGEVAIVFIDSLRSETADSSLFALQRGTVLERQKRYDSAAAEFYSKLDDTARVGNEAEKKLLALLSFGESEPAAETYILTQADLFRQPRALKILSTHYLKSGQYEKAFEFTISRDSLQGPDGRSMETFMRSCHEHRLYDQAVRTGDYLFGRRDSAAVRDDVYLIYGDALTHLGRFEEAIAVYEKLYAITRQRRFQADALYRIGTIYLDNLSDFDRALIYLDSVETFYGANPAYLTALVIRPLCYVRKGELKQARAELEELKSRPIDGIYKERAQYSLALVHFYQKQIDSAQAALSRLLVDFPRGMYVNDAVRLLFIVQQAQSNQQLLYDYSNALLFLERRMVDSAVIRLNLMAESQDQSLADLALYELAIVSLAHADTLKGMEYIDLLARDFPESYYVPYALRTKADYLSTLVDQKDRAREIYRHLLENFPNFPFISEVRQQVRKLEGATGSS
ncbi:MAG: tetratricopeptide repeat protein [Candidatus Zixiibacteriota bacterium]|nr:MAG: tetratricopeptide repeat protein [candidate division Zixibacteria bacterium]